MITARERIKECSNSVFVSEQSELVDRLVYAFHEYTKEAIKTDRINLVNHAEVYFDEGTTLENVNIDKDSIINAPNIELL